ncbi:MAG: outer membrane beta-barrel protein [Pseudohongiella sp.]|nr:outer membrane beta-barrel protein [Pseudohongiella sp.]
MKTRLNGIALLSAAAVFSFSHTASADYYVAGSYGLNSQGSSNNDGVFTSNFTTGTVTGVTPPLQIPSGSPVGWRTNFDNGDVYALAFGRKFGQLRVEFEYSQSDSDVDSHRGVTAAGLDLSGIDAGVLISGNVGDLGVSVAGLVADGRGHIKTSGFQLNALYDFDLGSALTPFVGVGLGQSKVDVTYIPSGVGVISNDDRVFSYQIVAGLEYALNNSLSLVGTARYRDGNDATVRSSLLPASFDVQNTSTVFDIGIRYTF